MFRIQISLKKDVFRQPALRKPGRSSFFMDCRRRELEIRASRVYNPVVGKIGFQPAIADTRL
jgi:hypothetical protein